MPTRLVPAVVVAVLLVTSPIAAAAGGVGTAPAASQDDSPSGGAAGGGSASGSGSAAAGTDGSVANESNETREPPGGGVVDAVVPAADGGRYLAGSSGLEQPNTTLTRVAPNGTVRWQRTFGGADEARAASALAGGESGVYLLERVGVRTPGNFDRQPTAELRRIEPDGSVAWTRSLGNATLDPRGTSLVATSTGSALLAQPGTERETARVREFAADGTVAFDRTYGGGVPRALAVTDDGDYLVAGQADFRRAWLLRLNATGAVERNESYGSFNDRRVTGVVPTADGGALLGGSAETRGFSGSDPWVARVGAEGAVRWSRTYGAGADVFARSAATTEDGVLLLSRLSGEGSTDGARLTRVTADGAVAGRTLSSTTGALPITLDVAEGTARLYGVQFDRRNRTVTGTVRPVELPTPTADTRPIHATVSSNETFYRGQNLRFPGDGNATHELYRLPTEFTEFDEPALVRRVAPDGPRGLETATLTEGRYAVRAAPGYWFRIDDRRYRLVTNASEAAFELDERDLDRVVTNRTVVETYDGEHAVEVRVGTTENLTARVGLTRLNGSGVATDDLRAALAAGSDEVQVFTRRGRTYGAVALQPPTDEDGEVDRTRPRGRPPLVRPDARRLTLDASALPAGLYELSVTGNETADATETGTTRLVVVEAERPVGLAVGNRSLSAGPDGSASTELTLTGVEDGIGAIRFEANSTGPPAIRLGLRFGEEVETGSASAGSGVSRRRATAEVQSLDVRESPDGNVTAARLEVEYAGFLSDEDSGDGDNRTTVHVGPVFVVDEDGIPYSIPEETTVTFELTDGGATEESEE